MPICSRLPCGSTGVRVLQEEIAVTARVDVPVLTTGESGTEKTRAAHTTHADSHRNYLPIVEINSSDVSDAILKKDRLVSTHRTPTFWRRSELHFFKVGIAIVLDGLGELSQKG
jgi:transcriptional regulator of aromatic amino acid metabolism